MQIKLPKGAIRKGAIVGGTAAIVVLAITASLRLMFPPTLAAQDKPNGNPSANIQIAQVQSPNVNGDCNVIGSGNSIQGGINCPKVQPNPPTVQFGQPTVKQRADGTYDLTVEANLVSQTPTSLLIVSAEGSGVLDFQFEPGMSGQFNNWYGKMDDNGAKALGFTNPQIGRYILTVHTATAPTPANVTVRWNAK
jgi:hypothetical protein